MARPLVPHGGMPWSADSDAQPAEMEKINTHIITLTRFLTEEQAKHKEATGDFTYARAGGSEEQAEQRGGGLGADMRTGSSSTRCSSPSSRSPTTSGARRSST